jgi:hypothetical protein
MPRIRNVEPWAQALRDQVRHLASGWTVRKSPQSGRDMLKVLGETEQAITLPFDWAPADDGDAYVRAPGDGHSLQAATELAAGKAPNTAIDWAAAVEHFQQQTAHHGATIKPATWQHSCTPCWPMQRICSTAASLPSDAAAQRWADALRLLAELGLRPIELLHLEIHADPMTREPQWSACRDCADPILRHQNHAAHDRDGSL